MSSDLRLALVAAARAWVGTPHGRRAPAIGEAVDGWGLVRAVGEACGVLAIEAEAFAPFAGYAPQAVPAVLAAFLIPLAGDPQPGDVALLGTEPALLADFNGRATLIRVAGEPGSRVYATKAPAAKVAEHGFAPPWPQRVTAWFRFPGLVA